MIMKQNKIYEQDLLNWENVQNLEPEEIILVNSNRIYWQLSELIRLKRNQQGIDILIKKIHGIKDEKEMYIPMQVEDVKICFRQYRGKIPLNTFKTGSQKNIKTRDTYLLDGQHPKKAKKRVQNRGE